jgi:hypothetical protein
VENEAGLKTLGDMAKHYPLKLVLHSIELLITVHDDASDNQEWFLLDAANTSFIDINEIHELISVQLNARQAPWSYAT